MSDALSASFARMVQAMNDEVATLKLISDLRDVSQKRCPENVKNSLREVEKSLVYLESQFDVFDGYLDRELQALQGMDNMKNAIESQRDSILNIEKNIPDFLRIENREHSSQPKDHASLITMQDFEGVPQSTRSRLTLGEVIEAHQIFRSLISQKEKVCILKCWLN
jgi:hypothetical protein